MKKFDISQIIISRICDVYAYSLPRDTEGTSTLEHSVLIIKRKGKTEYEVGGKKYLADPSNILFIPAGTEYSMYVYKPGDCVIVEFDIAESQQLPRVCEFATENDKEIAATVKGILHFWKLKGPSYHSKCLSGLYTLVTQLSTVYSYTHSLAGKYGMIHKSIKFIEANYRREDLYTPDLAAMSDMGETYYRSIFLSVFSVPPAKYIQNYRVEKAKELLVNTSGSIEEIATEVGFANSSYFCKVFKSTTGLTPTEFAEKSRKLG